MKLRYRAVSGALGIGLILAGCAGMPRNSDDNPLPTAALDSSCVMDNDASRMPRTGVPCSASGRSYSSEDILLTGATTAGRALQLLDPAVTLTH